MGKALRSLEILIAIMLLFLILKFPTLSAEQGQISLQVGARGDDASRGNMGVQAAIRTHIYDAERSVLDYFWVGTILQNGAFVQFGYGLEPGVFCLKGVTSRGTLTCLGQYESISNSDARWQWQYWPNLYLSDFYYAIGPANSAGANGTWHEYSITFGPRNNVVFLLDGGLIGGVDFQLLPSNEPPLMVAEKASYLQTLGDLGPVEFRNLTYLGKDGWHGTDSLVSISGCGINTTCQKDIPYGVSVKGPNSIVAGSGIASRRSGELLWTSAFVSLNVTARENAQFHITTVLGDKAFTGHASTEVPKGLFVYVRLSETSFSSVGFLGSLGAVDEFQGWEGYSRNQSVRLLMDQNRTLTATWRTTPGRITDGLILLLGILLTTGTAFVFLSRRKKRIALNRIVLQAKARSVALRRGVLFITFAFVAIPTLILRDPS